MPSMCGEARPGRDRGRIRRWRWVDDRARPLRQAKALEEGELIPVGRPPAEPASAEVGRPRRKLTGMRVLILLLAGCGLIVWVARVVWEYHDPIRPEAVQAGALRALGSRKAAERVEAIQTLAQLPFAESASRSIRPLTSMLEDEDSAVRVAAAGALDPIGYHAIQAGLNDNAIRDAVSTLIRVLKAPDPGLRRVAARTLGTMSSTMPETGTSPQAGPPPSLHGGKTKTPAPEPVSARPSPVDRAAVIAALTEALGDREATVRGGAIVSLAAAFSTDVPPRVAHRGVVG